MLSLTLPFGVIVVFVFGGYEKPFSALAWDQFRGFLNVGPTITDFPAIIF